MDRNITNRVMIKCSLIALSTLISFSMDYSQPLWVVVIISTISGLLGAISYLVLPESSNVFSFARPFIMVTIILPWTLICKDKVSSLVYLIIDRGFLETAIVLNMIAKVYEKIQLFRDWLHRR